ncbi:MAG TPA: cupin domain-containing protein [Gaiellaceae bacterium]|nr:cupin domain-containing protein [Gaiellaceae bacterium]
MFESELGPGSTRDGYASQELELGPRLGAVGWGGTVYELGPGERICPYHWHVAEEEWLLVLEGEPTLRGSDGDQSLRAWDVAVFRRGPGGAHEVRNDTDGTVRVLMLSTITASRLEICVYPDSGKMDAGWTDSDGKVHVLRNRPENNIDYFDGER